MYSVIDLSQNYDPRTGKMVKKFSRTNQKGNKIIDMRGFSVNGDNYFVKQSAKTRNGKVMSRDFIIPENMVMKLLTSPDPFIILDGPSKKKLIPKKPIKKKPSKKKPSTKKKVSKKKKSSKKKPSKKKKVSKKKKPSKKKKSKKKSKK